MPAAGLDHQAGHRFYRNPFAIQFHETLPLEDQVDFSQIFMVVDSGIFLYIQKMQRSDLILIAGKSPARKATWTTDVTSALLIPRRLKFRSQPWVLQTW